MKGQGHFGCCLMVMEASGGWQWEEHGAGPPEHADLGPGCIINWSAGFPLQGSEPSEGLKEDYSSGHHPILRFCGSGECFRRKRGGRPAISHRGLLPQVWPSLKSSHVAGLGPWEKKMQARAIGQLQSL